MARPVYPYELNDPDFSWLISNFQESNPEDICFECGCMPVVFFVNNDREKVDFSETDFIFPQDEETYHSVEKK